MSTCETIQECRFTPSKRNRVVRHIRKSHPSKQPLVGSQVIRNRRYKDPGSGLLPLQPVTEGRSRYRTTLAERRRQEASYRTTSTLERSETNARDQEVIADGQNCYVVTRRLWGSAGKRLSQKFNCILNVLNNYFILQAARILCSLFNIPAISTYFKILEL